MLDIAENAVRAGATLICITINDQRSSHQLSIEIADNGCGMDDQLKNRVTDPFVTTRTTRSVGLGLPLFRQAAEETGGRFELWSASGEGTRVCARFCSDHLDMMPLGDIAATVTTLIQCNPKLDFCYHHQVDDRELELDTRDLRQVLGEVGLDTPQVALFIREYLCEHLDQLYGGATPNEIS